MSFIGIPYGRAGVDERGGFTQCPECGVRCYAEGNGGYDNEEDAVTKGAARAYAFHYEAVHE